MAAKKKPAGKAETWARNRGKQPVANTAYVEVRLRNGTLMQNEAGMFVWSIDGARVPAGEFDIMAWRRARKPRQPKAEPVTIEDLAREANKAGCAVRVAFDAAPTEPQHVVLAPAPPNPDTVWIAGRLNGETWDFQGVFRTEAEAVAACVDHTWFVGPAVLGFALPAETVPWVGAYYPKSAAPAAQPDDAARPAVREPGFTPVPVSASQSEYMAGLIRKHGADWHRHVGRRPRLHLWPLIALCIVVLAAIATQVIP